MRVHACTCVYFLVLPAQLTFLLALPHCLLFSDGIWGDAVTEQSSIIRLIVEVYVSKVDSKILNLCNQSTLAANHFLVLCLASLAFVYDRVK